MSKLDLKPELELTGGIALRSHLAEALAGYRAIRRIELRRVKQVVTLGPELNVELVFRNRGFEVLHHDGIDIARVIVANIWRARPGGLNGKRRCVDERSRVEPPRQGRVILQPQLLYSLLQRQRLLLHLAHQARAIRLFLGL